MLLKPTRRRAGASLVEVLVGFGILGIGVTSVITLFPFSALTIGQALRDDRTTTCAVVADGQLRDVHQHYVVEPGDATTQEPYHRAMDGANTTLPPLLPTDPAPSYPVYVDPMGFYATGGRAVGDNGETGIPRVNLQFIAATGMAGQNVALRYCSLMDSLSFDADGNVPNNFDMRELRYNFAWMLQRPSNRDRFTVRMQVVVYNKRAHLYAPPGSEAVFAGVRFTPGETAITLSNVPATAEFRKGTWVMDGTINPNNRDADGVIRPLRHAEFYRVVSVTDLGNNTLALEVHKPVVRADGLSSPYAGNLVVMPGVADVFDRPNLTSQQ